MCTISTTDFPAKDFVMSIKALSFPLMMLSSKAMTLLGVSWTATGAATGGGGGGGAGGTDAEEADVFRASLTPAAPALGETEAISSRREVAASKLDILVNHDIGSLV